MEKKQLESFLPEIDLEMVTKIGNTQNSVIPTVPASMDSSENQENIDFEDSDINKSEQKKGQLLWLSLNFTYHLQAAIAHTPLSREQKVLYIYNTCRTFSFQCEFD